MLFDNPPDHPCFGCGPGHPRGLRLAFSREGEEVATAHVPREGDVGWPGRFHTGLHFSVLFEASSWAAWERSGHVVTSFGPASFDQQRLPRTGQAFTARARVAERGADALRMRAWSASAQGRALAALDAAWRFPSRAPMEHAGPGAAGALDARREAVDRLK